MSAHSCAHEAGLAESLVIAVDTDVVIYAHRAETDLHDTAVTELPH